MSSLDPVTLAVIANRLDSIVREMENTLLRTGRSAVLNMARDFSCALITGDNRLLASAEGLPVHVIGMEFLAEAMTDLHDDLAEGDAFLHNDPYLGNTHPADHVILVPVFAEGRHVFTAAAKAHQADCGNAQPTTYMPYARDVYEEGSLIFPAVRVQRDYRDIDDVIRMCRRRIRVPDQWYGDYLAMLGAARIGEARLKELCDKYGLETLDQFVEEWFDYSERRIAHVISQMPKGTIVGHGLHDPFGPAPDGIPINVKISVDPDGRDDRSRPHRQHRLPAGRSQRVPHVRDEQLHDRASSTRSIRTSRTTRGRSAASRSSCARTASSASRASPLLLGGDDERRRAARRHHAADDRRRLGGLRPRGGRMRHRPGLRRRLRNRLAQGPRPVREPEVPRLAGRPGGRRARRLAHVRQRRHERPDVPRQRRDRRAEVSDPHPRDPGAHRLRGCRAAGAAPRARASRSGRSTTR